MGVFDNEEVVDGFDGGRVYFEPGTYVVEVLECLGGAKSKTSGLGFFVSRNRVLKSTNPARPPGTVAAQVITFKPNTPYMPNIIGFVAAASNSDRGEVDKAALEMVISEVQPLKGKVLSLTVTTIKTEKNKRDFNVHTWSVFPGSQEEAEALKKSVALGA